MTRWAAAIAADLLGLGADVLDHLACRLSDYVRST